MIMMWPCAIDLSHIRFSSDNEKQWLQVEVGPDVFKHPLTYLHIQTPHNNPFLREIQNRFGWKISTTFWVKSTKINYFLLNLETKFAIAKWLTFRLTAADTTIRTKVYFLSFFICTWKDFVVLSSVTSALFHWLPLEPYFCHTVRTVYWSVIKTRRDPVPQPYMW